MAWRESHFVEVLHHVDHTLRHLLYCRCLVCDLFADTRVIYSCVCTCIVVFCVCVCAHAVHFIVCGYPTSFLSKKVPLKRRVPAGARRKARVAAREAKRVASIFYEGEKIFEQ